MDNLEHVPAIETPTKNIVIAFHPDKQAVALQFDPKDFKTWDYVLALLKMAVDHAEQKRREAQMIAMMQQQQQQAQQDAAIRQRLNGRGH